LRSISRAGAARPRYCFVNVTHSYSCCFWGTRVAPLSNSRGSRFNAEEKKESHYSAQDGGEEGRAQNVEEEGREEEKAESKTEIVG
jgi:hypothetical protein